MGRLYGREPFRPGEIILQIAAMQWCFWLSLTITTFVGSILLGEFWTLQQCFYPEHVEIDSGHGWIHIMGTILTGFTMAVAVALIVQRMKKSLDFVFTTYFIHFIAICCSDSGFPTNGAWWIVTIVSFLIAATLGEYLCLRKEMQDISVEDILAKRARAEARLRVEAEAEQRREAENMRQRVARSRSTISNDTTFRTPPNSPRPQHELRVDVSSTTESKKRHKRGESASGHGHPWSVHGDWFSSLRGIFKNSTYAPLDQGVSAASTQTPTASPLYHGWRSGNLAIPEDIVLPQPQPQVQQLHVEPVKLFKDALTNAQRVAVVPFTPFNVDASKRKQDDAVSLPATLSPRSDAHASEAGRLVGEVAVPHFGHLFRAGHTSPRHGETEPLFSRAATSNSIQSMMRSVSRASMTSNDTRVEHDDVVLDIPNQVSIRATSNGNGSVASPVDGSEPATPFAMPASTLTPGSGMLYRRQPPARDKRHVSATPTQPSIPEALDGE